MQDVFGQALYNYWKGDRKTPYIIRRDDGHTWKSSLNEFFTPRLEPPEHAVIHHAKGKILDVGCGAGRHILFFEERGFEVTGIDRSPFAIQVCKGRGCKRVMEMDIQDASLPPHFFDTLLLFGHNIGIGGTLEGVAELLTILRKFIKPSGLLLLTSTDVSLTNKPAHLQYHLRNRQFHRYIGEIRMRIEYKNQVSNWFDWVHVDPLNLFILARMSGWRLLEVHQTPYDDYGAVLRAQ